PLREGCQPAASTRRPSRRRFPKRTANESGVGRGLAAPTAPKRAGKRSIGRDSPFSRTNTDAGPLHLPPEILRPSEIQAPPGARARTRSPLNGGAGVAAFPGSRTAVTQPTTTPPVPSQAAPSTIPRTLST